MFARLLSNRFQPRLYCPDGEGFWSGHLPLAADLVEAAKPSSFVELGTYYGESYFGFCQAIQECGLRCSAYAIDNWAGDLHTGQYGPEVFEAVSAHNAEHYAAFSSLLRTSFDEASALFPDGSIELLHLDGCHTYAGVKHDFETWLPKVAAGGIIVIHDIAVQQENFGVRQFWAEISNRLPSFAFHHSCGLGLLLNRRDVQFNHPLLAALFGGACDPEGVREHYALCAERLQYAHPVFRQRATACQIFWPRTGGYSEEYSSTRHVPLGQWAAVEFQVPSAGGCLRLDPANCPAIIEISEMVLRDPVTQGVLWQLDAAEGGSLVCRGTAIRIPEKGRLILLSYGEDPQLYLPALPAPQPGAELHFSCCIRIDPDLHNLKPGSRTDRGQAAAPEIVSGNKAGLPLPEPVSFIRQKIAPLRLAVNPAAPRRVNLLIPTVDFNYLFGGYIAKLNLARRLAKTGCQVRILIVDECDYQPAQWRRQLLQFEGLASVLECCEWAYAFDRSKPLEANPTDGFVATTWWTAHIAHQAAKQLGQRGFVYLIQEYEPFTFPMGTFSSLARETYGWPHYALFSTEFLRDYFRQQHLGVFAEGGQGGEQKSAAFQNAVTRVDPVTPDELRSRERKKLLFYARPEIHAARNMFESGLLALCTAIENGVFGEEWEFTGIGSVAPPGEMPLARGRYLKMLRRQSQADYKKTLAMHDLGLSLMYTPHPSLVPIEMASAGMVVVTNTFHNKTAERLRSISPNLLGVKPTPEDLVRGLETAATAVGQFDARAAGARVNWCMDWNEAFHDALMNQLKSYLAQVSAPR